MRENRCLPGGGDDQSRRNSDPVSMSGGRRFQSWGTGRAGDGERVVLGGTVLGRSRWAVMTFFPPDRSPPGARRRRRPASGGSDNHVGVGVGRDSGDGHWALQARNVHRVGGGIGAEAGSVGPLDAEGAQIGVVGRDPGGNGRHRQQQADREQRQGCGQ